MTYEKKIPLRKDCGLHLFKELLNGKWKLMLIYYISTGLKRPGELQRKIGTADRRVLANQLSELVLHGFVSKVIYDTKVPKVEYELTDLGKSLLPVILNLEAWGESNRDVLEKALPV
ncbi:helix-turn-helix transcriptional regulator [Mucilaginibacter sp. Bleaf8]|uniref:winged helix-turn-helix transcriptional regulator n=1 Tax=Mucilaginibacter sp. Bleaf8 TaxID=2834430 RepID=UPI001BCEB3F2|nr:helix-turn-helix domain-containing protein [Mucilaginibacter sp. Bleaf8]MBS7565354.1 helix-turn-helix transcriptional regulator [Mucilaginibacter sp. Bleaf8]